MLAFSVTTLVRISQYCETLFSVPKFDYDLSFINIIEIKSIFPCVSIIN